MNLSNNIVSEFVKMTNDSSSNKKDQSKIYGTVVLYGDEKYVQLDGSDMITPADSTVHIKNGERVTVTIKDHTATIDGNLTDVSASHEHLVNVENDLVTFKVDVDGMFLEVRNDMNTKFTQFEVKYDGMFVEVHDKIDDNYSKLSLTIDGLSVEVNKKIAANTEAIGSLRVHADNIVAQVETKVNNNTTAISSLQIRADSIQTEVSKKVDGAQVGTIVTQNADSWGLSINGKLSGTNYTFDGTNFTIGSTSGNTTAYHAPGYSKWTHSDGSWTRVDAHGMTWNTSSSSNRYHSLMYAGEYICESQDYVTVTLPEEFKGKPFKIVTSIKRIYVSLNEHITNCRFPLLQFYAEATSVNHSAGTFTAYASVRAWNRTGYGGYGQLVGNGADGSSEATAIKPVVAFWAFV